MNTYLEDFSDLDSQRSISDVHDGANLNGGWERLVGASNTGVVSLDLVVSGDLELLVLDELNWGSVLELSGTDLWSLGVKHDSAGLVWALLEGLLKVSDRFAVGLDK